MIEQMLEKLRAELQAIWQWPVFKDEALDPTEMASIAIRKARALEILRRIQEIANRH